ncbi:MAG: hypothetical protein F6J93_15425 [Oscillatoria sp. SIO1A7]|nr:hypothetical protein [Oscillatoria sp. SIO1A7]
MSGSNGKAICSREIFLVADIAVSGQLSAVSLSAKALPIQSIGTLIPVRARASVML